MRAGRDAKLLRCVAVSRRTIPQRELRNDIGRVLREAGAGTEFTITVRGKPIARLGPADAPQVRRVDVEREALQAILAATPVDEALATDIAALREVEASDGDPWANE